MICREEAVARREEEVRRMEDAVRMREQLVEEKARGLEEDAFWGEVSVGEYLLVSWFLWNLLAVLKTSMTLSGVESWLHW